MCVQWHGTKCTPGITPGPGETSRRVERGDPDWTVSNSRKYLLTGNREPGSRDHQTAGRPPIGNRCGSWTIPAREYSGASTPMPLPPPPAVSPPSPRFLRPVGGGVLGRLSLAPWGSGIAIRWTGTPPGQRGRHTRGTSSPAGTGVGDPGNRPGAGGRPGDPTRRRGPAHTGDQQPGGYRSGRPWDAAGRGRSTRVSPETVRPAHDLLAELWQGNPAGSERGSPVGPLRSPRYAL